MIKTKRQASRIKNLFDKDNMMKTVTVRTIKRANSFTTKALGHAGVSTAKAPMPDRMSPQSQSS
jgi:hypothetical protein